MSQAPTVPESASVTKILAWAFLLTFIFLTSAADALYRSQAAEPSSRYVLVYAWAFLAVLWCWFRAQCRPYRRSFPMDMGFFLMCAWIFVLPAYLWRQEGWRGLGKFFAVIAALGLGSALTAGLHYLLASWS